MKSFGALFTLSLITSVLAQQLITTTNAAGNTIIEQVTTNAFGQTVTQILQTVGGAATTTSAQTSAAAPSTAAASTAATSPIATATATTTQAQQGPVGQPAPLPTTPGGPTPFTYTTTDANGNPVVTSGIFTPSFPATTPYTPTGSGTVLGYSQWLSMIGNNTSGINQPGASQAPNSASRAGVRLGVLLGAVSMVIMSVVGGQIAVSL